MTGVSRLPHIGSKPQPTTNSLRDLAKADWCKGMMVNKEGRSAIYRAQGPEIFERRKAVGMLLQSANVSVSAISCTHRS